MPVGTVGSKTVQIHLGRTCNLKCAHCYSLSGPGETEVLPKGAVIAFLESARKEGYERASFSGGEPMVFADFPEILNTAKVLGYRTNMVTNGTFLPEERWRAVRPHLDLLAISIDGPEHIHNKMRGNQSAFSRTYKNLDKIRSSGIPFGFVHTLTLDTLPHLEELAQLAIAEGASLLQLHPLGLVGAGVQLTSIALDGEYMSRAYLVALWLKHKYKSVLKIQIDLFNREVVGDKLEQIYAVDPLICGSENLADILNPLVLMSDGSVSPVCYGMHPRYLLGSILTQSPEQVLSSFKLDRRRQFHSLCSELWLKLQPQLDWPYFNWYEHLERASWSEIDRRAMTSKS